jgi:hypothetical protein
MSSQSQEPSSLFFKVMRHILFWILIVTYFAWGFGFNVNPKRSFLNALLYVPGHAIMVYSLLYWLVPRYLIQKKYLQFFLGLLFVLTICAAYGWAAQLTLTANDAFNGFTMSTGRAILPFLHVAGIALSIKLLGYWYRQKQQTLEAEQKRTLAELQLLKAQLHPHFLFNTLNNLYSHVLLQSPHAPDILLKLAGVLRFMIYESNSPRIPLEKEVDLLKNYIALEHLRYGERLDISISIQGDIQSYQIPPLLLLPFLENAFKHGTSQQIGQCWISLDINIENSMMNFKLINSIDKAHVPENASCGGFGLQNVERRLELLYGNNYHYEAIIDSEFYMVVLDIALEAIAVEHFENNPNVFGNLINM